MRRKSLSPFRRFLKKFELAGRDWLGKVGGVIFGARRHYDNIPPAEIRRILLFKIDERLGNMILLTPFVEMLHQALPAAEIDYCAARKLVPLIQANPAVSKVYAFTKWQLFSQDGWPVMLHRVRRQKYDLVIDCSHPTNKSVTHALLTRFSGARYTIGARRQPLSYYYTTPVTVPAEVMAEREKYPCLLAPLGIISQNVPPLSYFPTKTIDELSENIKNLLNKIAVVVNMGAGTKDRFLDPGLITGVLEFFEKKGLRTLVTWGPAEEELATAVIPPGAEYIMKAPPTTVNDLYYLMKGAKMVICGDTGPMHLAVATGTPTLALFIKGEPQRFGHNYAPHKVLLLGQSGDDLAGIKGCCEAILK